MPGYVLTGSGLFRCSVRLQRAWLRRSHFGYEPDNRLRHPFGIPRLWEDM